MHCHTVAWADPIRCMIILISIKSAPLYDKPRELHDIVKRTTNSNVSSKFNNCSPDNQLKTVYSCNNCSCSVHLICNNCFSESVFSEHSPGTVGTVLHGQAILKDFRNRVRRHRQSIEAFAQGLELGLL